MCVFAHEASSGECHWFLSVSDHLGCFMPTFCLSFPFLRFSSKFPCWSLSLVCRRESMEGDCGHARLIWHSKDMADTTSIFFSDGFCTRSTEQFIVGDDVGPKEVENYSQCSLITTNYNNCSNFLRFRRFCPCTHQPTSTRPEYLRLWFVQLWSAAITEQILCTWWLMQCTCIPLCCLLLLQLCR